MLNKSIFPLFFTVKQRGNMKNKGKIFEEDWKKSNPENSFLVRLHDSPQVFNQSDLTKFTVENMCDYISFDTTGCKLYCMELKSTCQKAMSFQTDENDRSNKMIKWHQIKSLRKAGAYRNIVSGFVLNFRCFEDDKTKYFQTTYFMKIDDFDKMIQTCDKKSFNLIDVIKNGGIKVDGERKRTRYSWDIDGLYEKFRKDEAE